MSVRERRCLRLGRLFGAIKRVQQCGHGGTVGRCGVDVNAPAAKTTHGERREGSCAIGVHRAEELVVAWLVLVLGLVLAVMAASIRTANAVSGPLACTALRTTVSGAICALPSGS